MAPVKIYDIPVRILRILEDNSKFFVLKMVRHQTPGIDFIAPSWAWVDKRPIKSLRSISLRNISLRSIPRPMTWCNTPGASNLANLGIPCNLYTYD